MIELAFSILAADFAHLADEIARAERGVPVLPKRSRTHKAITPAELTDEN